MATVPNTISNSIMGPNFGHISSPWMVWNPLLAMIMATPQQAQAPLNTVCAASSSSKGKGKRLITPSEEMPASKRGKYPEVEDISSADSDMSKDEEELAEPFDPSSFYNVPKRPLPDNIEKYADLHFCSCLSGSVRKAMGREIPLPNCHALRSLQADDTIKDFMDRDFPKKTDDRYKRMQLAVNASVAPALNLWQELEEHGISASHGGLVPVDTVLDVIQRTVVSVGNASDYISQCRRDNVITKMEFRSKGLLSVMKSVCKKHKPEGDLLFGSAVHKALTKRAETVSALKKVATKIQEPGKSSYASSGLQTSSFFQRGSTLDHGRGSGKIYRPQNRSKPRQFHRRSNTNASPTVGRDTQIELNLPSTTHLQFPISHSEVPPWMGGRLKYFKHNREVITTDHWVRNLLSGYVLPFITRPPLSFPSHRHINLSVTQIQMLQEEISDLLQKQAIRRANPRSPGYYSQMFVVPKKDGAGVPS